MTQQMNEYSIVMAEFMGYEKGFSSEVFDEQTNKWSEADEDGNEYPKRPMMTPKGGGRYYFMDALSYHISYDWLMPVWIKFNDLGFDENVYLNDTYQWFISRVGKSILNDPIKTAFEEMYKAIEWYNKMSLC